jgi:hypothetical protein
MKQSRFILRGYGRVDILSTVVFSVTAQQTIRSFPKLDKVKETLNTTNHFRIA